MSNEPLKKSKLGQHGVSWAAVIVAGLGWYDARSTAGTTKKAAVVQAVQARTSAEQWGESRARNAWEATRFKVDQQNARIDLLVGWIVELEAVVVAGYPPTDGVRRTARERRVMAEEQAARLQSLRAQKARREWAVLPTAPLPAWGAMQESGRGFTPPFAEVSQ